MRTKVALFGSAEFCQRAKQFTEHRSEIILDLYPYTIYSEAPNLLKSYFLVMPFSFQDLFPMLLPKKCWSQFLCQLLI